eukprot:1565673-Rhodomonas_salina.1
MMKGIQAQLSSACIASMEMIFTTEAKDNHLLKPMSIWKRMVDSVHKISKDHSQYMTALQRHASNFTGWELEDINTWMKRMEMLCQDLLRSCHTEDIADDCIVNLLLNTLKSIPTDVPHGEEWKFAALSWKTEQTKNHSM